MPEVEIKRLKPGTFEIDPGRGWKIAYEGSAMYVSCCAYHAGLKEVTDQPLFTCCECGGKF